MDSGCRCTSRARSAAAKADSASTSISPDYAAVRHWRSLQIKKMAQFPMTWILKQYGRKPFPDVALATRGSSSSHRVCLRWKISTDMQVIAIAGSEFRPARAWRGPRIPGAVAQDISDSVAPRGGSSANSRSKLGYSPFHRRHRTSQRPCDAGKLLCNQYPAAIALHEDVHELQAFSALHAAGSPVD